MKTIFRSIVIYSLFFLFGSQESKAQGNLQFNQVVFYDFAASGTQAISVPAGKVWKIETANSYNGSNTGITLRNSAVQSIAILSTVGTTSTSCYPFWLPTGFTGSLLNNAGAGRACMSIIEFNVIP